MLKENGYEVHVAAKNNLAEKNGLRLSEPDKIYDVPFDRSPLSKNNILAYRDLSKLLSENNYDIVHCNTPMGGVLTRLAGIKYRKRGMKIFYTAHGFHFYKGAPKKNWIVYYPIEKFLAKYTDKLITITKEDFELADSKFKTKVVYIHGVGANSDRFKLKNLKERILLREEMRYSNKQFLILCIGELNNNKNQETVINALLEVKEHIPDVKLLLAGNGPKEKDLKQLVSELGLNSFVDFLGYRTDIEKYISLCDIVVSASVREGLPLNIMEAMLCGKPVIASNNRGHSELIDNNISGIMVEPHDFKGISENMIKLFENENLRNELIKNALSKVSKFTYENVLKELKRIYEI